jgi:hypothetical protein
MEKFGIENLKKLLQFSFDLTKQIATSTKDGWQWTDSFSFIDEASEIPGVVKSWPAIKQELGDLSEDEKKELNQWVADNFGLDNAEVESKIEHALQLAINAVALVDEFKKKAA